MKAVSQIAHLREQLGLTQLELSQLLEITENTVANWERGRSGVECIERVVKLCKIFKCSPEDLIAYIPDDNEVKSDGNKKQLLTELQALLKTSTVPKVQKSVSKNSKA